MLARFGPKTVRAIVGSVTDRLDLNSLAHLPHTGALELNDVGTITLRLADEVAVDDYDVPRTTGAFILVDDQDGSDVGGRYDSMLMAAAGTGRHTSAQIPTDLI